MESRMLLFIPVCDDLRDARFHLAKVIGKFNTAKLVKIQELIFLCLDYINFISLQLGLC
jgi:hypothetical protein